MIDACSLLPEIHIRIVLSMDDANFIRFGRLNKYTLSLYNDGKIWVKKIDSLFPSIPIAEIVADKDFNGFIVSYSRLYPRSHPINIIGLYNVSLMDKCTDKLSVNVCRTGFLPIVI